MKARMVCAFAGMLVAAPALPAGLDEVVACVQANIPETVRIQTVEIRAVDRVGGERDLRGRLFGTHEAGSVRIMMRIDHPSDLAGAAYLVRETKSGDEMFLFLPALNKVRRITGASLDGQLWGTDLSYADVKNIQNAYRGSQVSLEGAGEVEQRPVHVLSIKPRAEDASRYSRIRTHIDRETCVALLVEFHEPVGVRKTVSVKPSDVKKAGRHWYAAEAVIRDLQSQTRTHVKITDVKNDEKLSARYFNPQSFHLGH